MINKINIVVVLIFLVSLNLFSSSQLGDFYLYINHWQQAGHLNDIPIEDFIINVLDSPHNFDNTGSVNVGEQLNDLISNVSQAVNDSSGLELGAIYFPPGIYLVKEQINMKNNVILKGDGSDLTEIKVLIGDYNNQQEVDWEANCILFNNVNNSGLEDLKIK